MKKQLTKRTESLAAMANISAQDTTPVHALSTALFMESITSNPLAEFRFGTANFSLVVLFPSKSTDPSHPYHTCILIILFVIITINNLSLL